MVKCDCLCASRGVVYSERRKKRKGAEEDGRWKEEWVAGSGGIGV